MEILNKINENIGDVKQRLARIEAQEHTSSIRELRAELQIEINRRSILELEVRELRTRIMPIIVGIAIVAAPVLSWVFDRL